MFDDRDTDYNPSIYSYQPSNAETTPSHRADGTKMTDAARRRVDHATENLTAKRCLIENTNESNHVDYSHCLPRSTKPYLLDRLEFAWKMERFTLNVDTRYNVLRLSAKFHRAYDSNQWLLLPETSIIDAYYATIEKTGFPTIDNECYKYTLISHPAMLEVPIHRQKFPPPQQPLRPSACDFTYYPHPYHDFPTIVSHVHPRFVICNSGSKLEADVFKWQMQYEVHKDDLAKVQAIWNLWRMAIPKGPFVTRISVDDDPDIKDDDSHKTTPCRIRRSTRPKRKAPEEQHSPTPQGSKQQKLMDSGMWLDDETLHEFDNQVPLHPSCTGFKDQFILDWLTKITRSGQEVEVDHGVPDFGIVH